MHFPNQTQRRNFASIEFAALRLPMQRLIEQSHAADRCDERRGDDVMFLEAFT